MKFEFSKQTFKNNRTSNFMKIRSMGAELFRADRDDKASSSFSQFYESAYQQLCSSRWQVSMVNHGFMKITALSIDLYENYTKINVV
jgi:hypothetical protein